MLNKVLCVDDDDVALFISKVLIQNASFAAEIETASTGSKALDYFETLNEGDNAPEVIFLDLNMPEMDGWQFLTEFQKKYGNKYSNIYIVILSSTIDDNDRLRADKHKLVDRFICKPLTHETLGEIYNELQERN